MTEELINRKNNFGNTALMEAVQRGQLACVEEMAKLEGVDWEAINDSGESLKDVARRCGKNNILTYLNNSVLTKLTQQIAELKVRHNKSEEELRGEQKKKRKDLEDELLSEMEDLRERNRKEAEEVSNSYKIKPLQKKEFVEMKTVSVPRTPPPAPECPVCLESLAPPARIHNCPEGHLVCGDCRLKVKTCGLCRKPFHGRATAMEQYLRAQYGVE